MTGAPRDAALEHLASVLDGLTPTQLADLAEGRGRLVFRPGSAAPRPRRETNPAPVGAEVVAAVLEINMLTEPVDVMRYLERQQFPTAVLKEIARALGPTVSAAGRSRADLVRNIVEGTAGFRTRSAAMSGGAWN